LGIPWLLAILIIVPLLQHVLLRKADAGHLLPPFWQYWIGYLKSFGTYQIGLWTPERTSQIHFWFLSLLLTFFIALGLFQAVKNRRPRPVEGSPTEGPASNKSILEALFVVSVLNQALAANSYNICLSHIFFVTFFQDVLMVWPGGPAMVKAGIVFLVVLPISYGISRLIDRSPRGFVIGFIVLFLFAFIARR
jgi:uncharacterized membrane protein YiaA